MYWQTEGLDADLEWLAKHGYRLYRFNCERWSSDEDALTELGARLDLADYGNWNAFSDCLADLDVPIDGGAVIVLMRYDRFAKKCPATAHAILDICANNARIFMLFGQRLATLVQSDDPRLSFDLVGATPVMWNRREWMDSQRGL
jgi:hypothetical protein